MKPISHQLYATIPAVLTVLLVFVSAVPLQGGVISYTPNMAFLMTLILTASPRYYWPRGLAFLLGLLQDVLFGTPLGAQALLAVLLAQWVLLQQARGMVPLQFRLRWISATGILVGIHVVLWVVIYAVGHMAPPFGSMLIAGAMNGLWYALFYWLFARESTA